MRSINQINSNVDEINNISDKQVPKLSGNPSWRDIEALVEACEVAHSNTFNQRKKKAVNQKVEKIYNILGKITRNALEDENDNSITDQSKVIDANYLKQKGVNVSRFNTDANGIIQPNTRHRLGGR